MQLVFSRFPYAPTTHVFHRYLMDAAVVSYVEEDTLALLYRAKNIIKACSLKISVIDVKGKRTSLFRIRALRPHEWICISYQNDLRAILLEKMGNDMDVTSFYCFTELLRPENKLPTIVF